MLPESILAVPTNRGIPEPTAAHLRFVGKAKRTGSRFQNALDLAYPSERSSGYSTDTFYPPVSDNSVTELSDVELKAIQDYSRDSSKPGYLYAEYINQVLRSQHNMDNCTWNTEKYKGKDISHQVALLDAALTKAAKGNSPQPKKTQRGIKRPAVMKNDSHERYRLIQTLRAGNIYVDPAYLSTSKVSVDTWDARTKFATCAVQLTIFGKSGIDLEPILGDFCGTTCDIDEGEVLYPRHTPLRVLLEFDREEHRQFETAAIVDCLKKANLESFDTFSQLHIRQLEYTKFLSYSSVRIIAEEDGIAPVPLMDRRTIVDIPDISPALPPHPGDERQAQSMRRFEDVDERSDLVDRWLRPDSPFSSSAMPTEKSQLSMYKKLKEPVSY